MCRHSSLWHSRKQSEVLGGREVGRAGQLLPQKKRGFYGIRVAQAWPRAQVVTEAEVWSCAEARVSLAFFFFQKKAWAV